MIFQLFRSQETDYRKKSTHKGRIRKWTGESDGSETHAFISQTENKTIEDGTDVHGSTEHISMHHTEVVCVIFKLLPFSQYTSHY